MNPVMCFVAFLVASYVLMSMLKPQMNPYPAYLPSMYMPSSARLSSSSSKLLPLGKCSWLNTGGNKYPNVKVADCADGNWKSISDAERKSVDEALRSFLSMGVGVMMVFAPWCPHCKTMMPQFLELTKDMKDVLIVNAETVGKNTFASSQEGSIFSLQYFPTFLKNETGTLVEINLSDLEMKPVSSSQDLFAKLF